MSLIADFQAREGDFSLNVAFQLPARARCALIGPNGSGKTTLLRALAGVCWAQGALSFAGETWLEGAHSTAPQARRIGMVFQGGGLLPMLSVLDNVAFGPKSAGKSQAESREIAEHWLTRVGAAQLASRHALALSGGEKQRVAMARAFAREPQLLLLDEPLVGVDRGRWVDLMALLSELLANFDGVALLVSHEPSFVRSLCQQVMALGGQGTTAAGTLEEIVVTPPTPFVARFFGRVPLGGAFFDEHEIRRVGSPEGAVEAKVRYCQALSDGWRIFCESQEVSFRVQAGEKLPQIGDKVWLRGD